MNTDPVDPAVRRRAIDAGHQARRTLDLLRRAGAGPRAADSQGLIGQRS